MSSLHHWGNNDNRKYWIPFCNNFSSILIINFYPLLLELEKENNVTKLYTMYEATTLPQLQ